MVIGILYEFHLLMRMILKRLMLIDRSLMELHEHNLFVVSNILDINIINNEVTLASFKDIKAISLAAKNAFNNISTISNSFISYTIIKAKNKEDTQEFYYLSFIEISGEFNTVHFLPNLELTEAEIRIINESYFYILDHPEFKELIVHL